jgi:hypothetical protein
MTCRFGSTTILSNGGVHVCFWHKAYITIVLNQVRFWG